MGFESSGLKETSGDVVGEVAKPQGRASQVFKTAIDRFGGSVGGAGAVEVGHDVDGSLLQCFSQGGQFLQDRWNPVAELVDQGAHDGPAFAAIRVAVGGDGVLIHLPGDLDFGMVVIGEQGL